MWQAISDGLSIFAEKWPVVLGAVGIMCLASGLCFFRSGNLSGEKKGSWRSMGGPVLFFAFSVILRLAFLTETFVPPYFDSVAHYRIIKELVSAIESSTVGKILPSLTSGYYHLGFHFFASFLTLGLRAHPIDVILVLGQVTLAAIPIPVFFLIHNETKCNGAAFFAFLLAGFGWYMPGFAVNWGKYPALLGLLVFEFVLCLAYFISRARKIRISFLLIAILTLSILLSILIHSRTLVVILISFVSWLIANRLGNLQKKQQLFATGILLTANLLLVLFVQQEPLLNLALDPYLDDGKWITLIVITLSPFVFIKYPRGTSFSMLFTLFILAALFIPVGAWFPVFGDQTLLDRPFVEMLLFLPLSILGGLGLAGFLQVLGNFEWFPERIRPRLQNLIAIVFLSIVGLVSIRIYDFTPSDCCNFVKYDDTVAIDWLDRNLPPDARILISATQLHVLPSGPSAGLAGTDAGIWIPALSGRVTTLTVFNTDFRLVNTLAQLCQQKVDYIYIGNTIQNFNISYLLAKGDWYKPVLSLPNTQLFEVIGCSN